MNANTPRDNTDYITQHAAEIDSLLDERIAAGDFPSAIYLVWHKGEIKFANARGLAVRTPRLINATIETICDLASLTKPLITTLLCARFIEHGALDMAREVKHYLPAFASNGKGHITVQQLLTHTAGLAAWRSLCELTDARTERALEIIAQLPLAYESATRVVYSDLGFIALGALCERIGNESLAALAAREIFEPLKLTRTYFNPPAELRDEIAAAESRGNIYEREMATTQTSDLTIDQDENLSQHNDSNCWRTRDIWGEVHDGNAYFLGGAAGHAGLFSTAHETAQLAAQFLAAHSTLLRRADTFRLFDTNMTPNLNEVRSIGWQLAATRDSTAGASLPPASFGHTGFTGTSVWIDGAGERVFILLTNRTHDHALPFVNINATRRRFHTLANELTND